MFRHGQLIKSLILCLAWSVTCISFYALSLHSSDLSGDAILNFFLARTTSFGIGIYVMLTSNFIGRRYSFSLALGILGSSCIILAFLPKDFKTTILVVYLGATTVASACKLVFSTGQGFLLTPYWTMVCTSVLDTNLKKLSGLQRYQQTSPSTVHVKFQTSWLETVENKSDSKLISDSGVWCTVM